MRHPDFGYCDTAFGSTDRRNNVKRYVEIKDRLPEGRTDCYATWHRFPKAYGDHVQETGSVKNWAGSSYADFLPFDLDGPDLGKVLEVVRDFLTRLEVTYEIDGLQGVRVYFSGKKGFHLLLDAALFGGWEPSPRLAQHLKTLALTMAGEVEIDTAIYDQNRLFRLPNTRNSKSGLYKIPLTGAETLGATIDQILALASGPRDLEYPEWGDAEATPACTAVWKSIQAGPAGAAAVLQIPAPYELFPVGLKEGEGREKAAFRIARTLRDHKMPQEVALEILRLWDRNQNPPLLQTDGADILEKKIANAYGAQNPRAEDGRITVDDIKTIEELAGEYRTYIEKLKTRKILLGWPEVDEALRGIAPGEVLTVIAKSGVGKSVVLQNTLRNIARQQPDTVSLFCSLEQPLAQCFERYSQMSLGLEGRVIEDRWTRGEAVADMVAKVSQELGPNTLTCGRGGLSMVQVEQALEAAKEKSGKPVNVLAIDYLGMLDTNDLDRNLYAAVSKAARRIKSLAKEHDLAVILLCQVSRASGEAGNTPLTLSSARESGAIEESADFLLGLYRPEARGDKQFLAIQVLKNRKGAYGIEFEYEFDPRSLRVTSPGAFPALSQIQRVFDGN
ncbi:MAG: AAA family ATPase [Deltaproteobacteria bacterium]|nr:AAA family ATPase [Deltaproteobacteria bacterium]